MENNNFALMILGCDKHVDLLPMFFRNVKKYWPQYDKEIYVNVETDRTEYNDFKVIYPSKTYEATGPWGKRILDFVKECPYEYIVFLLDDFILADYVDHEELLRVIEIMRKDPNIACFNFMETYKDGKDAIGEFYERYYLKDRKSEFRMNLQAALWRKSYLIKFMREHENPWQFETWGSVRARRYNDKVFHIKKDAKHVFIYPEGGVLADGKWYDNKTLEFFEKENFDVDLSRREVFHPGDPRKTEINKRSFLKKVGQVLRSLI